MKSLALQTYERGRLKAAFKLLWIVIPVILISLCTCGEVELSIGIGAVLGILVVLLKWRGEEYGASVGPGLWAGIAAFSVPLVLHLLEICCRGNLEILFCTLSGAFGGVILGFHAGRSKRPHKGRALFFAVLIACLTSALGCAALGISASLGLFVALAITALSTFALKSSQFKVR